MDHVIQFYTYVELLNEQFLLFKTTYRLFVVMALIPIVFADRLHLLKHKVNASLCICVCYVHVQLEKCRQNAETLVYIQRHI